MAQSVVTLLLAFLAGAECFGVSRPLQVQSRAGSIMMGDGKPNNTPAKFFPKGEEAGYVNAKPP